MMMIDEFNEQSSAGSPYYIPDEMECRSCNRCASHCPTFKVSRNAAESPRGRLKLIAKVLQKAETLTGEELGHLESCLQCRACESVCPSKMAYSDLLNEALEHSAVSQTSPIIRALLYASSDKQRLQQLFSTLRRSQQWGLQSLVRRLGLFKVKLPMHYDHLLPKIPKQRHIEDFYPALAARRGAVGLFTGCLGSVLDQSTQEATIKLLTHLGYDVHIPKAQQCCGALHRHNHDLATARELAVVNLNALVEHKVDAVIYSASGCGSMLRQYQQLLSDVDATEALKTFTAKLTDVCQFVAATPWPAALEFAPLTKTVAVHEPCSQRFPVAAQQHVYALLRRIPGLTPEPLAENNLCCGAGGSHMLSHPAQSQAIRADKITHIGASDCQIVVSSNLGCALHLAAGIDKEKMRVTVAHPVELLAQQLQVRAA